MAKATMKAAGVPVIPGSDGEVPSLSDARRIAEELDIPLIHTYHTVYEDYTHYFSPSVRWGRRAAASPWAWSR